MTLRSDWLVHKSSIRKGVLKFVLTILGAQFVTLAGIFEILLWPASS